MSESGAGPVLIIQNIENECFADSSTSLKLSCHAGVAALADISNSEKMNVELTSAMKRPLPNDDDELFEVTETKKVKLIEDNQDELIYEHRCSEKHGVEKIKDVNEECTNGLEKSVDELVETNEKVNGESIAESNVEKSSNAESYLAEDSTLGSKVAADVELGKANSEVNGEINGERAVEINDNTANNLLEVPTLESNVNDKVSNIKQEIIGNETEVNGKINIESAVEINDNTVNNLTEVPTIDSNVNDKVSNINQDIKGNESVDGNSEVKSDIFNESCVAKNDSAENNLPESPILDSEVVEEVSKINDKIKENSTDEPATNSNVNDDTNIENNVPKTDNAKNKLSEASILECKVVDEVTNINKEVKEISINESTANSELDCDTNCGISVAKSYDVENNLPEAPTLESENLDEMSISEKIDLCDNSNSNNLDINTCSDNTASLDNLEKSTNSSKTETANAELVSNVEVYSLEKNPVNDVSVKNVPSPDLIKNIQDTECSSYDASPSVDRNIEPTEKSNDNLKSKEENTSLEQSKKDQYNEDDVEKLKNSKDEEPKKCDSEIRCDESEFSEPTEKKNESIELDDHDVEMKNVSDDTLDPLDVRIKEELLEDEENTTREQTVSKVDSKIHFIDKESVVNMDFIKTENSIKEESDIVVNKLSVKNEGEIEKSIDTMDNGKTSSCAEEIKNNVLVTETSCEVEKEQIETRMDTAENCKITSCAEEIRNDVFDEPAAKKLKLDVLEVNVVENYIFTEELKEPNVESDISLKLTNKSEDIDIETNLVKTISTDTENIRNDENKTDLSFPSTKGDGFDEKAKENESSVILEKDKEKLKIECDEISQESDGCSPKAFEETTVINVESLESTTLAEESKIIALSTEKSKTTDLIDVTEASSNVESDFKALENKLHTICTDIVEEKLEPSENVPNKDSYLPKPNHDKTAVSNVSESNQISDLEVDKSNEEEKKSENRPEGDVEIKDLKVTSLNVEKDEENKDKQINEPVVGDKTRNEISKLTETGDSDIEIVDDSDKAVHQSKGKGSDDSTKGNEEKADLLIDQIEVTKDLINDEEGDLMIDEKGPDSDIELISDDAEAADEDKENGGKQEECSKTSQNQSDITAMDVDEIPPVSEIESARENESKTVSPSEIDTPNDSSNKNDEANVEKKSEEDVSENKDDDDEIIFIKECKKASDCTCVMCYQKKATPDKSDANKKDDDKSETNAKDKLKSNAKVKKDLTNKNKLDEGKIEKKNQVKKPKLIEKFDHLSRKDLERVVTQMFVKAFAYESELGVLRELVVKAQMETKAIKTASSAQAKQLKELTAVHEKALADLRAFQEEPGREGSLHPLKITRNVGLQVNQNIAAVGEKKRLGQNVSAAKSPLSSPALSTRSAVSNGVNKLKRPLNRPLGYTNVAASSQLVYPGTANRPSTRASPNSSNASSPQGSAGSPTVSPVGSPSVGRRANPPVTPRPGRPPIRTIGGAGGLRVLPPRALNSAALRSPTVVSPRQSPLSRLPARSPNTTSSTTGSPIGIGNKTSGGASVDIINLDDDDTAVQAKNNTKSVRSPPNAVVRSPSTTIRLANATNTSASSSKTGSAPQRVFVPSSQGYKIRASTGNSQGTIFTSLPNTTSTTTYVLNTAAGLIPFQTNNVRLNIRPNATSSPVRLNYQGHPAPVPPTPKVPNLPTEAMYQVVPGPPKLRVQLAQEGKGIQLTWSLDTPSDMATIESYQLYAYQENKAMPINSNLWKNIGKLDALPLPMACTLTQFTSGHTYHFLVRAVDVFKRFSAFSNPGTIHLRT